MTLSPVSAAGADTGRTGTVTDPETRAVPGAASRPDMLAEKLTVCRAVYDRATALDHVPIRVTFEVDQALLLPWLIDFDPDAENPPLTEYLLLESTTEYRVPAYSFRVTLTEVVEAVGEDGETVSS